MGINISGKGVLSGIASLVMGAVNNILATRILGYTVFNATSGNGSYYTTTITTRDNGSAIFGSGTPMYSSDGTTILSSDSTVVNLQDGIYAKNKYVAIGQDGIFRSTDGVNWVNSGISTFSVNALPNKNIKYFQNNFYAVVKGTLYKSSDGTDWTNITNQTGLTYCGEVIVLNNKIVVKGSIDNFVFAAISSDAFNWTTYAYGIYPDVAGNRLFYSDLGSFVKTSTDGTNWSNTSIVASGENEYLAFLGTNSKYAIVYAAGMGNPTKFVFSSNGTTFTELQNIIPNQSGIYTATIINDIFFVLAYNTSGETYLANSSDGQSWSSELIDSGIYQITHASYVDGKYVFLINNQIFYKNGLLGSFQLAQNDYVSINQQLKMIVPGPVTLSYEVQSSIGDQGTYGAEVLFPVEVYKVPVNKTSNIEKITIKNLTQSPITFDLAILDESTELDQYTSIYWDQSVLGLETFTFMNPGVLQPGQRIVVLPSAVNSVEVKVFGTEV